MKARRWSADRCHHPFVVLVNGVVAEVFSDFIRKHQSIGIVPQWTNEKPPFRLFCILRFQQIDNVWSYGDCPTSSVF